MWHWKDVDLARRDVCAREGTTVHGSRDGAAAIDDEVVPRVPLDVAACAGFPDRRRSQWCRVQRPHRRKRGATTQRPHPSRRSPDYVERLTPPQAVEVGARSMGRTMRLSGGIRRVERACQIKLLL